MNFAQIRQKGASSKRQGEAADRLPTDKAAKAGSPQMGKARGATADVPAFNVPFDMDRNQQQSSRRSPR